MEEATMVQQTEKKLTLKPLGNRVLVKRLEQKQTLKGGIILPDTAKKRIRRSGSYRNRSGDLGWQTDPYLSQDRRYYFDG